MRRNRTLQLINFSISFQRGDYVFLSCRLNNDWYIGEANGRKGLVPASFVRIISDADVSTHSIQAIVVGNFVSRNTFELDLTAGTLGKYPTQLYHLISHQSDCCSVHGDGAARV